jgi:hypothetical protein
LAVGHYREGQGAGAWRWQSGTVQAVAAMGSEHIDEVRFAVLADLSCSRSTTFWPKRRPSLFLAPVGPSPGPPNLRLLMMWLDIMLASSDDILFHCHHGRQGVQDLWTVAGVGWCERGCL